MTPEQVEQIIEMLAEKLGPLGEHVWAIYVRQVYISVIGDMIGAVMFLLAALGFLLGGIWCANRYTRNQEAKPRDSYAYGVGEYQVIGLVICGICGPTALIIGLWGLSTVTRLLNPEYYAIQMLLGR